MNTDMSGFMSTSASSASSASPASSANSASSAAAGSAWIAGPYKNATFRISWNRSTLGRNVLAMISSKAIGGQQMNLPLRSQYLCQSEILVVHQSSRGDNNLFKL